MHDCRKAEFPDGLPEERNLLADRFDQREPRRSTLQGYRQRQGWQAATRTNVQEKLVSRTQQRQNLQLIDDVPRPQGILCFT